MLAWLQRVLGSWRTVVFSRVCMTLLWLFFHRNPRCNTSLKEDEYAIGLSLFSSTINQSNRRQFLSRHTLSFWHSLHAPPSFLPSFSSCKPSQVTWLPHVCVCVSVPSCPTSHPRQAELGPKCSCATVSHHTMACSTGTHCWGVVIVTLDVALFRLSLGSF